MVPRGGTPLGHGAPSLEASNQAQIDDLVQRNRTLEHTVKKLTDRLSQETIRSKDAATEIQKQWQVAQSEWRQGCDILQSCHRVVQLRNTVELEKERMNVLKELDITRMERVKRLQRDFRITMFQARETELEERIAELQEERQSILTDAETTARQLKGKSSEHVAQLQAKCDELVVAEQEKEELEVWVLAHLLNRLIDAQCPTGEARKTARRQCPPPEFCPFIELQTRANYTSTRGCSDEACRSRTHQRGTQTHKCRYPPPAREMAKLRDQGWC